MKQVTISPIDVPYWTVVSGLGETVRVPFASELAGSNVPYFNETMPFVQTARCTLSGAVPPIIANHGTGQKLEVDHYGYLVSGEGAFALYEFERDL